MYSNFVVNPYRIRCCIKSFLCGFLQHKKVDSQLHMAPGALQAPGYSCSFLNKFFQLKVGSLHSSSSYFLLLYQSLSEQHLVEELSRNLSNRVVSIPLLDLVLGGKLRLSRISFKSFVVCLPLRYIRFTINLQQSSYYVFYPYSALLTTHKPKRDNNNLKHPLTCLNRILCC